MTHRGPFQSLTFCDSVISEVHRSVSGEQMFCLWEESSGRCFVKHVPGDVSLNSVYSGFAYSFILRTGTLNCVLNIHCTCSQPRLHSITLLNVYIVVAARSRSPFCLGTIQSMTFPALQSLFLLRST